MKILPSSFLELRNIWSFHGVVLKGNAMTQNARAGLLFNSLNLLSGDVLVHVAVVVCLIVDVVHYSGNGMIVSLTIGRNNYSGIFQNIFLFRNKVNGTHPNSLEMWALYRRGTAK